MKSNHWDPLTEEERWVELKARCTILTQACASVILAESMGIVSQHPHISQHLLCHHCCVLELCSKLGRSFQHKPNFEGPTLREEDGLVEVTKARPTIDTQACVQFAWEWGTVSQHYHSITAPSMWSIYAGTTQQRMMSISAQAKIAERPTHRG